MTHSLRSQRCSANARRRIAWHSRIVTLTLLAGLGAGAVCQAQSKADRKKASLGGKFKTLLRSIEVPADEAVYGKFKDWGPWNGTEWAGFKNLPAGYWVYVAPTWFIWKQESREEPPIIRTVAEAARLTEQVTNRRLEMRKRDNFEMLATVLKRAKKVPVGQTPLDKTPQ